MGLIKAPFVCNGCESKPNCKKRIKYFYDPYKADEQYRETLSSSRSLNNFLAHLTLG